MVAVSRPLTRPIRVKRPPQAAAVTASLLGALLLVAYFAAPHQLPLAMVCLVGLVSATLAMLLVVFFAREYGVGHKTYKVARWRVGADHLAGGVLFALVLAWWLSPWAPIRADWVPIRAEQALPSSDAASATYSR